MKQTERHPRLNMYYDSSAMNIATIGAGLSLVMLCYTGSHIISIVALSMFLAFSLGYTLWYWIGKPKTVKTSKFLSGISFVYLLYAIIVANLYPVSEWWGVFALVAAIASILIYAVKGE